MRLLLLGPPGSGKGTQAGLLAKRYGLVRVAPGDVFRQEMKAGTDMGRRVAGVVAKGELVDDETTAEVCEKVMFSEAASEGFVLDGYPRNLCQANKTEDSLARKGLALDLVINLVVEDGVIVGRAKDRRVCGECGKSYSLLVRPPKVSGKCDVCGGALIVREDDREDIVRNRLRLYEQATKPLEQHYDEQGILVSVDGQGTIEEVEGRIRQHLRSRGLIEQ